MGNDKFPTGHQSRADELEERLIDFAVRVINLSANLPRTPAGKHIAGQILRSGTSPAPNYGEARGAESHAVHVAQMREKGNGLAGLGGVGYSKHCFDLSSMERLS